MVAGYVGGLAAQAVRLPRVTGYIIAGLALSPSLSGILQKAQVEAHLGFVSEMALAVIAFAIGGSLHLSHLKRLGKPILWITFTQGMGAFICASGALLLAGLYFGQLQAGIGDGAFYGAVLLMGSISAATAPAAVMAVVHEMRAKGPLVTTLLGVVALDDALTIVLFSLTVTLVSHLWGLGGEAALGIFTGLWEIGGGLALGGAAGMILPLAVSFKARAEVRLMLIFGAVFLVGGLAIWLGFSPLLANMTMGFVLTNRMQHADDLFHQLGQVEELIYCLFFSLAGAHFDLAVFSSAAFLLVPLMLGRFSGKLGGTWLGARISRPPAVVGKYLGFALLPKAGVSLGLIFLTREILPPPLYHLMLNAMLASVIINELVAPPLLKWALNRAGESLSGD